MTDVQRNEILELLRNCGFTNCRYRPRDGHFFLCAAGKKGKRYRELFLKEKNGRIGFWGSDYEIMRKWADSVIAPIFGIDGWTYGRRGGDRPKGEEAVWFNLVNNRMNNQEGTWFAQRQAVIDVAVKVYKTLMGHGIFVEDFNAENYAHLQSKRVDGINEIKTDESSIVVEEELVDNALVSEDDPFASGERAVVVTVERLLRMNLRIPEYQRPYKWTRRNVEELMRDISDAVKDIGDPGATPLKYRLGTVIVDSSNRSGKFDVVDGQQRILTLLLVNRLLNGIRNNKVNPPLLDDDMTMKFLSRSRISRKNLNENYEVVKSCLAKNYELRKKLIEAFNSTLEMVVVKVNELSEAFQLFDSQNTRGRAIQDICGVKGCRYKRKKGAGERKQLETALKEVEA